MCFSINSGSSRLGTLSTPPSSCCQICITALDLVALPGFFKVGIRSCMPISQTTMVDGIRLKARLNANVRNTVAFDTAPHMFVTISYQLVADAVEQYTEHPFSKCMALRTAIIASNAARTDALAATTEEFFFRLGTTGYLNLNNGDAKRVSHQLQECQVMQRIIKEHRLWPEHGLPSQCLGFKCQARCSDCCTHQVLFTEPDFGLQSAPRRIYHIQRSHL